MLASVMSMQAWPRLSAYAFVYSRLACLCVLALQFYTSIPMSFRPPCRNHLMHFCTACHPGLSLSRTSCGMPGAPYDVIQKPKGLMDPVTAPSYNV